MAWARGSYDPRESDPQAPHRSGPSIIRNAWGVTRYAAGAAAVTGGVTSHWVLDALTHQPDLPLIPGATVRVGLGLWNPFPATLAVESIMFGAAVWMYASVMQPRDRLGRYGFWRKHAV